MFKMISSILKRCCGLDVHKESITATLLKEGKNGKVVKQAKEFGTYNQDTILLKNRLTEERCEAVCMESTVVL